MYVIRRADKLPVPVWITWGNLLKLRQWDLSLSPTPISLQHSNIKAKKACRASLSRTQQQAITLQIMTYKVEVITKAMDLKPKQTSTSNLNKFREGCNLMRGKRTIIQAVKISRVPSKRKREDLSLPKTPNKSTTFSSRLSWISILKVNHLPQLAPSNSSFWLSNKLEMRSLVSHRKWMTSRKSVVTYEWS